MACERILASKLLDNLQRLEISMANNLRILPTLLYNNNSDLLVLSLEDKASLIKIKKESHWTDLFISVMEKYSFTHLPPHVQHLPVPLLISLNEINLKIKTILSNHGNSLTDLLSTMKL
jgi:hypothetical protein